MLLAVLARVAWIVWNAEERRLRALVRIALQLAVMLAMGWGLAWAFTKVLARHVRSAVAFADAPLFVLSTLVSLFAVCLGCRFLDRRSIGELGLRIGARWWIDATFGFVLGGLLMGGILGAEVAFDWARYAEAPDATGPLPRVAFVPVAALAFVCVAIYEELVSRGYHLTNLAEGLRCRWIPEQEAAIGAAVLSSIVFGVAHASNPGASWVSTTNIVVAGMMLAAGYLTTGRLGLPMGLHLSWNFFQNFFGMPVSGQTRFFVGAVLTRNATGPEWVTGGAFGPEAGATGLVAMFVGTLLILAWVRVREGTLRIHPRIARLPLVRAALPPAPEVVPT